MDGVAGAGVIGKLTGAVDAIERDRALIDVRGVGYVVRGSARTLATLAPGAETSLLVETLVREDAIDLYGFATVAERDWFRLLTTVQGVGSKVALAILSALSTEELQRACATGDAAQVARAQGVGPKLAGRIVNELEDKAGGLPGAPAGVSLASVSQPGSASADAVSALQNLGFKPAVAASAVAHAQADLGEGAGLNDLVRVALKRATG